jgi:hypothetical protein
MPFGVDALGDVPAEHDQGYSGPADHREPSWVDGVRDGFDRRGRDGIGIPAPVVPGEDEGGVIPPAAVDDGLDSVPDQVLPSGDVARIAHERGGARRGRMAPIRNRSAATPRPLP